MDFMDFRISDLPEQFTNIANKIGIEHTKELFKEFGGTSVYFPTVKKSINLQGIEKLYLILMDLTQKN